MQQAPSFGDNSYFNSQRKAAFTQNKSHLENQFSESNLKKKQKSKQNAIKNLNKSLNAYFPPSGVGYQKHQRYSHKQGQVLRAEEPKSILKTSARSGRLQGSSGIINIMRAYDTTGQSVNGFTDQSQMQQ